MTGFVLRRILSAVLVIVLTSMFVFVLFFKGMGAGPAVNYCDRLGAGRQPVALVDGRGPDHIGHAVLVLEQQEDDPGGGGRALAGDHHPRHRHADAVAVGAQVA